MRTTRSTFAVRVMLLSGLTVSSSLVGSNCSTSPAGTESSVGTTASASTWRADAHRADWDNDGYTDVNIFRASTGQWAVLNSSNGGYNAWTWGRASDWPVLGDYDGDGKEDVAYWRPAARQLKFLKSTSGYQSSNTVGEFGVRGAVPVPGDYDGDGFTDPAYWTRQESPLVYGMWHVNMSSGQPSTTQWGAPGDEPVPADYDGDHKTDYAVWRPLDENGNPSGYWVIKRSLTQDSVQYQWGTPTDIPVPGIDYDEDGKADITVYRARTGYWLYLLSSTGYDPSQYGSFFFSPGGDADTTGAAATDIPVVGNFDDSAAVFPTFPGSAALWRPSTGIWTSMTLGLGSTVTRQWGAGSPPYLDFPVNGLKRYPYSSPTHAAAHGGPVGENFKEMTALTVPPNVASCGAGGAALLSGSPSVYKYPLACWKPGHNDASCAQSMTSFDLSTQDPDPAKFGGSDQNIIRMNNGHILVQHLATRYEAGDANKRYGVGLFFESTNCGDSFSAVNELTLGKANFGNDWKKTQFDHSMLFNNPYSGRIYFTVSNLLHVTGMGSDETLVYWWQYSPTTTQAWSPATGHLAGLALPANSGGYMMTSSPRQRQYLFTCNNNLPTIYVFSETSNVVVKTMSFGTGMECETVPDDTIESWGISLVSSEEDGDVLQVVYPQIVRTTVSGQTIAAQHLKLAGVKISGTGSNLSLAVLSTNQIFATSSTAGASTIMPTFIEPDMLEIDKPRQATTTLLYWMETDGLANINSYANPGVKTTVKGKVLRDLNLWAPTFPIVGNDSSGNPQAWTGWNKAGEYVRGGFVYDAASDMLQFFPVWRGPASCNPTCTEPNSWWTSSMVLAHP